MRLLMPACDRVTGPAQVLCQVLLHLHRRLERPAVASLLPQEPVATASAEEVVVVSDSVQDEPHREQEASPYQQPKHRLYCCLHSSSPLRRHGRHW